MKPCALQCRTHPTHLTYPTHQTYATHRTHPTHLTYPTHQTYATHLTYSTHQAYRSHQTQGGRRISFGNDENVRGVPGVRWDSNGLWPDGHIARVRTGC